MKKPLIVISGATACGKTEVSIELAKRMDGEIVSADSMQVYIGMDIGTAKPSLAERAGVVHHLIDVVYPNEPFSVAVFQELAKEAIDAIHNKGKMPILVGGTGFYINSLIKHNNFMSTFQDDFLRSDLTQFALEQGTVALHQKLQEIDPVSAEKIHPNNVKRVIRAIEYYNQTGQPISIHNEIAHQQELVYDLKWFILDRPREELYPRINLRVDNMVKMGLVEEVRGLLEKGYTENLVSMQGLGYKELVPYLKGTISLETAIDTIKQKTRHFAKRQGTWFRNQCDGQWIHVPDYPSAYDLARAICVK